MSCENSASLHPLITQNLVDTKKFYCPFLERGYCRDNSKCNFSHEIDTSIRIPNDYCHFYLANQCLYGLDCKFRHVEPSNESSASAASSSTSSSSASTMMDTSITTTAHTTSPITTTIYSPTKLNCPTTSHNFISPFYSASHWPQNVNYQQSYNDYHSATYVDEYNIQYHQYHQDDTNLLEQMSQKFSSSLPALSVSNFDNRDIYYSQSIGHHQSIGHINVVSSDLLLLICDLCGRPCLKPHDLEQQRQHREECLVEHEREMELSFAIQRSKDQVCGICMDVVVEKKPITSSRFGILEKCNHIFCLDCIRKWRGTKQMERRTIRACPECRTCSDFVVPSKYWVEDKEDKDKLIHDYKAALKSKPCKYFKEGRGECPFAGSCFYKHAYPDGRIAKLDHPKPRRRFHGTRSSLSTNFILWSLLTSTDDDDDYDGIDDDEEVELDDDDDDEENEDEEDEDHEDEDDAAEMDDNEDVDDVYIENDNDSYERDRGDDADGGNDEDDFHDTDDGEDDNISHGDEREVTVMEQEERAEDRNASLRGLALFPRFFIQDDMVVFSDQLSNDEDDCDPAEAIEDFFRSFGFGSTHR